MNKLQEAISKIRVIAELLEDDDPDKVEMMNIEADYIGLIEWALTKIAENSAQELAAKELQSKYKARADMFANKQDRMRDIVKAIMSSAGENKFSSGVGTVSLGYTKPKPIVNDESLLPEKYKKKSITIDKALINKDFKDGIVIDGVGLDNGGERLTIRI